jgi:hypothetical protein
MTLARMAFDPSSRLRIGRRAISTSAAKTIGSEGRRSIRQESLCIHAVSPVPAFRCALTASHVVIEGTCLGPFQT